MPAYAFKLYEDLTYAFGHLLAGTTSPCPDRRRPGRWAKGAVSDSQCLGGSVSALQGGPAPASSSVASTYVINYRKRIIRLKPCLTGFFVVSACRWFNSRAGTGLGNLSAATLAKGLISQKPV